MEFCLSFDCADKSPSIWDQYFHEKAKKAHYSKSLDFIRKKNFEAFHKQLNLCFTNPSSDNDSDINGDVACDSYNLLDEDIKNLIDLNV